MHVTQRVQELEDEFSELKEELRQIMLDIRSYLMEANSPLRSDSNTEGSVSKKPSDRG